VCVILVLTVFLALPSTVFSDSNNSQGQQTMQFVLTIMLVVLTLCMIFLIVWLVKGQRKFRPCTRCGRELLPSWEGICPFCGHIQPRRRYTTTLFLRRQKIPEAEITVLQGEQSGRRYRLAGENMLLGRDAGNELLIEDDAALPQHALIKLESERYMILSLDPNNKVFVNGKSIETHQLQTNDEIKIGDTILTFRYLEDSEQVDR
jgi:hypothetical protein